MGSETTIKVALIGNPNSGKSSVFNRLTGFNQHVGNFPGVTVDKKSGEIQLESGTKARIIDLPGAYSLYPNSIDERIVLDILLNPQEPDYPDAVIYIADTTSLERHLLLLTQIIDLNIPVILALNQNDTAERIGISCDDKRLQKELGIPVIKINGRTGSGMDQLKALLPRLRSHQNGAFINSNDLARELIQDIKQQTREDNSYRALLIGHHYNRLVGIDPAEKDAIERISKKHGFSSIRLQVDETMKRFGRIQALCKNTLKITSGERVRFTDKIDQILTHKLYGSIIFFMLLFLVFQAIFSWAEYPMDLIDRAFADLGYFLKGVLPSSWVTSLLTDGIIAGLGGILIFIPQITILFGLIAILEEVGYMSRAVYLSDSLMQKFGLNGRSLVSLISGAACAVPAIMATRTIGNWKERFITIFITPFISCSARIPVLAVLISFVVPKQYFWGFINLQGLVMMSMYILGASTALASAYFLKKIYRSPESTFLMMELPVYQLPHAKNVGIAVFEKVKVFVVEAGKIILVISMILWGLASYGPGQKVQQAEEAVLTSTEVTQLSQEDLENLIASKRIEASYAGHFGKFIEPVIQPLGFDWKIGIALITSFAAREVFVSTMATIYSVGSTDDQKTIIERMQAEKDPATGLPFYTPAVALSLIVFYILAMQCMSTLAVVKRETKSWAIPFYQFTYMTGLAYLASFITYHLMI